MISPMGFLDSARERTLFSSGMRTSLPSEGSVTPNSGFAPRSSGQRTDSQFSSSSDPDLLKNPEFTSQKLDTSVGGGETETRGDDMRVQDLVARLRVAQSQLDSHNGTPDSVGSASFPQVLPDHSFLPLDSRRGRLSDGISEYVRNDFPSVPLPDHHFLLSDTNRGRISDVPERFHAGRESLSVRRNVTVRDAKRPKERSRDKEYKQRYSLTPGKQVGGLDYDRQSSGDNPSSPARTIDWPVLLSPYGCKPSPLFCGPDSKPLMGEVVPDRRVPDDTSITIILLYEGHRYQHQV
jgi:hypothetical protein